MDNELYHHGVLGMKWGVRKNKSSSRKKNRKSRKSSVNNIEPYNDDYIKTHSKKSIKSMSDEEIRMRINRLNLEKQYNQLTKSEISKGKAYVDKSVKFLGTVAAVTTASVTIGKNLYKVSKTVSKLSKK